MENESDEVRISKFIRGDYDIRRYYEALVVRGSTSSIVWNPYEQGIDDDAAESKTQIVDSESIAASSNVSQRKIEPRTSNRRPSRLDLETTFRASSQVRNGHEWEDMVATFISRCESTILDGGIIDRDLVTTAKMDAK